MLRPVQQSTGYLPPWASHTEANSIEGMDVLTQQVACDNHTAVVLMYTVSRRSL
jgi:hypothetical protein